MTNHRELVWTEVRRLGREGDGANDCDRRYITTVLLAVDSGRKGKDDTSVGRMAGTDEGRLIPGVYMGDIIVT